MSTTNSVLQPPVTLDALNLVANLWGMFILYKSPFKKLSLREDESLWPGLSNWWVKNLEFRNHDCLLSEFLCIWLQTLCTYGYNLNSHFLPLSWWWRGGEGVILNIWGKVHESIIKCIYYPRHCEKH